jgi:AcrR family transcriptional regulator
MLLSHCDVAAGRLVVVPRWEPNAEQRLERAALDLYATRGYDSTTVGDIAAHAGVTSRTYFRYFPDKREVLFGGADKLRDRITTTLRDAPAAMAPLDATLYAMSSCADLFHLREHERLRRRDAVISSSSELQERETRKLASIAAAVADGLIERGSDQDHAHLVADLALVVFKQASRLWMEDPAVPYAAVLHRAAARARSLLVAQGPGAAHE